VKKKLNKDIRLALGILGSMAGGAAVFVTAAYVRSARRREEPALLPQPVNHEIRRAVSWLDGHVGKEWVDRGIDALHVLFKDTKPDLLVQALEPIFQHR
jgi:hypothetical protein